MALQPTTHRTPVRPGLRLQLDPVQPVQHPAGNFFMQPGGSQWRVALPAGNSDLIERRGAFSLHKFAVERPEYIDQVFKRLLQSPLSGLSGLSMVLPSQCAVCRSWPSEPVCTACTTRFSAEKPRCKSCAITLPVDLSMGLRASPAVCIDCIKQPPPMDATLAAIEYTYPWSGLISRYKFGEHPAWASFFATMLLKAPGVSQALADLQFTDLILPVPLSKERLQARGFNQAWQLTRALTVQSGSRAKASSTLLLRVKNTQPQTELLRQERLANVKGAFQVDPLRTAELKGRRVILVDDVMTSGASLFTAAQALRASGATHITGLVLARTPL